MKGLVVGLLLMMLAPSSHAQQWKQELKDLVRKVADQAIDKQKEGASDTAHEATGVKIPTSTKDASQMAGKVLAGNNPNARPWDQVQYYNNPEFNPHFLMYDGKKYMHIRLGWSDVQQAPYGQSGWVGIQNCESMYVGVALSRQSLSKGKEEDCGSNERARMTHAMEADGRVEMTPGIAADGNPTKRIAMMGSLPAHYYYRGVGNALYIKRPGGLYLRISSSNLIGVLPYWTYKSYRVEIVGPQVVTEWDDYVTSAIVRRAQDKSGIVQLYMALNPDSLNVVFPVEMRDLRNNAFDTIFYTIHKVEDISNQRIVPTLRYYITIDGMEVGLEKKWEMPMHMAKWESKSRGYACVHETDKDCVKQ